MTDLIPDKRLDFMCIGAAKSGTTWLYHNLSLHPNISLSKVKEINYFNKYTGEDPDILNPNYGKPIEWYHSYFPDSKPGFLLGEFSTSYLKYLNCAPDLHAYNPKLKLIVILRNPVERVFSHYLFLLQRGFVAPSMSFEEAMTKRKYMLDNSLYFEQLFHYFKLFPKNQIKILWYDDLIHQPEKLYAETLEFLQIEPFFPSGLKEVVNPTKEVRSRLLNDVLINFSKTFNSGKIAGKIKFILKKLRLGKILNHVFILNSAKPNAERREINEASRKQLQDYFKADIEKLEALLDVDLNTWKTRTHSTS